MKFLLRLPAFAALFSLLLLTGHVAAAQPGGAQFQWMHALANADPSLPGPVAIVYSVGDTAGNTYCNLYYNGAPRFGPSLFPNPGGGQHMALAKLNAAGQVLWFKQLGTEADSTRWQADRLAIDAAGNLHAVLHGSVFRLGQTMRLDGVVVPSATGEDVYMASWTPAGVIRHAARVMKTDYGYGKATSLTIAPNGDALMAGFFTNEALLDTVRLREPFWPSRQGSGSAYAARVRPNGTVRWARQFDNADTMSVSGVDCAGLDAAGNTYLMGLYAGHTAVGGSALPPGPPLALGPLAAQVRNTFWVKLDSMGRVVRTRAFYLNQDYSGRRSPNFRVRPDGVSFAVVRVGAPLQVAAGLTVTPTGAVDVLVTSFTADGTIQWMRQIGGVGPMTAFEPGPMELRGDDQLYLLGGQRGLITGNGLSFGQPGASSLAVVALDQKDGSGLWALSSGSPHGGAPGWMSVGRGGLQFTLFWIGDTLQVGNLRSVGVPSVGGRSALVRVLERHNTLSGAAYLDSNGDQQQNPGEGGFPGGLIVEVNPGNLPCVAPAATGHYDAYVDLGQYTASIPNPPPYYTVVVAITPPVTFSTYGNVAAGPTFALQPIPNQQDVQVWLTQVSPARPGFPAIYDVQYRNVGTIAIRSGLLTLAPGALLTYVSSSPVATRPPGGPLLWAYANLQPGETRRVRAVFTLATTAGLGTTLSSTATLTPLAGDLEPADNTATASRVVTGSFDPNDITVNHVTLTTAQVATGEWLEYTIRFQNHGTDTAFTVLLTDSLPAARLRLSTLLPLAGSHSFGWSISPAGLLLVRFTGIKLPPQATNLLDSEGFIRFRIRPAATLAGGDEIPNQAQIHFDYSAPVLTNTAHTQINGPTGLGEATAEAAGLHVWPNPAPAGATVRVRGAAPAAALTLTDLCGRVVATGTADSAGAGEVPTVGLAAGVYVVRAAGAGGGRRVVVR